MTRILCIEDETEIRKLIVDRLANAGYQTVEAANGREGLEAIQKYAPGLVICDVNMPVMNGKELLAELREEHPRFSDMPFIFLSAFADRQDVLTGIQGGADDYITKPIDFELLLATVGARLDQVNRFKAKMQLEPADPHKADLELLYEVSLAANQSSTSDGAMQACVDSVCTHAEWPIGHVYLVAEDAADELVPTTHWHMADTTRFDALRTLTEGARLTRGQGLPGMALASGRPETSAAVAEIAGCPRAECLGEIGVRSGFAFPVYVGANIVAVLEFYSDKLLAPDDSATRFAAPLAALLGGAVAHERAQASLRESEERYRKLVEVHIKSEASDRLRLLLGARERMNRIRRDIEGHARGVLKTFGIRLGTVTQSRNRASFRDQLRAAALGDPILETVAASLIAVHNVACAEAAAVDDELLAIARDSELARRLMTVPGVGPIVALGFIATVDDVSRFAKATDVGAYLGLTPRRYQSGEMDYSGRISKRGDSAMRALLYEAASALITRVRRFSPLKSWAVRLAARKGFKKAAVATARKIAVVMLRLWRDGTTFAWIKEEMPA